VWAIYVSEILYFIYLPQYLYSPYARNYLTAGKMQNKIGYCKIAKILNLYLVKYNIPVFYNIRWATGININEY